MKSALITGITSQDGSYLAKKLLSLGYTVVGLVRNGQNHNLSNLDYLKIRNHIIIESVDLLDGIALTRIISLYKFDEIYNLAAQSSVGLSFQFPLPTMHYNTMSVMNLLEVIRISDFQVKFLQPVSSEMFGNSNTLPITENSTIDPKSPYSISKALAYYSVINYRESFKLFASNAILFNHESYLRNENFFIKKVIKSAISIRKGSLDCLKVGNLDVKRDFGYAPAYINAIYAMLQADIADDFIICSGKMVSLKEIVLYVFEKIGVSAKRIIVDTNLYRPSEISENYGSSAKIGEKLGWYYDVDFFEILDLLIAEELASYRN